MSIQYNRTPGQLLRHPPASDFKHATRVNSPWIVTRVDANDDVGLHSSLALDAAGHPRISFYDPGYHGSENHVWYTKRRAVTKVSTAN